MLEFLLCVALGATLVFDPSPLLKAPVWVAYLSFCGVRIVRSRR